MKRVILKISGEALAGANGTGINAAYVKKIASEIEALYKKVDEIGKQSGRGAYICKKEECLDKLIKSKRLSKIFETNIEDELYEKIKFYSQNIDERMRIAKNGYLKYHNMFNEKIVKGLNEEKIDLCIAAHVSPKILAKTIIGS